MADPHDSAVIIVEGVRKVFGDLVAVDNSTVNVPWVSPLCAGEALLGKFISYFLFTGIIAAILLALLVFVLHVPHLAISRMSLLSSQPSSLLPSALGSLSRLSLAQTARRFR